MKGDYLEGGLTVDLMAKDVMLILDLLRELRSRASTARRAWLLDLAAALGYGDQISNRVVDALGDIAGGVSVNDETREPT